MLLIAGAPVPLAGAQILVATLRRSGTPAAIAASRSISEGLMGRVEVVTLTASERLAVLDAIEERYEDGLANLESLLLVDQSFRHS
jgi:hypothetical protein